MANLDRHSPPGGGIRFTIALLLYLFVIVAICASWFLWFGSQYAYARLDMFFYAVGVVCCAAGLFCRINHPYSHGLILMVLGSAMAMLGTFWGFMDSFDHIGQFRPVEAIRHIQATAAWGLLPCAITLLDAAYEYAFVRRLNWAETWLVAGLGCAVLDSLTFWILVRRVLLLDFDRTGPPF